MVTQNVSRLPGIYFTLFVIAVLSACTGPRSLVKADFDAYECPDYLNSPPLDTLSEAELLNDTSLFAQYSIEDLHIANAFGLVDLLRENTPLYSLVESKGPSDSLLLKILLARGHLDAGHPWRWHRLVLE